MLKPSALVRSIFGGRVVGSVRRVSVSQAMRSRIHRMEPARAFITSTLKLAYSQGYLDCGTNLGHRVVMFSRLGSLLQER